MRGSRQDKGRQDVTEIRDDTTIGAIFAAAVSSHADRAVPRHPGQRQARLPARRASRSRTREAGRAWRSCRRPTRSAGYGLGHRVATLLENRPEHVLHKLALQRHRRVLRADQSGLPGGRDRLPPRAQQARPGADARRARGAGARGPGAERAQAAGGAVGARRRARLPKASRPARRRGGRRPRRRPASSTPPAPPGGRRAASSRTATRSRVGCLVCLARRAGDAAPGPGAHLQSAAALSRQRRRRVADGRHL